MLFGGVKLNDEDTLQAAGLKHRTKVQHKKTRTPTLRRTLSAFQPRSKEQAKASLYAAKSVEDALKAYSEEILHGSYLLCADIKILYDNQVSRGKKYSMETYRAMDILKKILGAVGGPLVLTALSSSNGVETIPNTLKLSQESIQNLMSAISPIASASIPVLPTVESNGKKTLGEDDLESFLMKPYTSLWVVCFDSNHLVSIASTLPADFDGNEQEIGEASLWH